MDVEFGGSRKGELDRGLLLKEHLKSTTGGKQDASVKKLSKKQLMADREGASAKWKQLQANLGEVVIVPQSDPSRGPELVRLGVLTDKQIVDLDQTDSDESISVQSHAGPGDIKN